MKRICFLLLLCAAFTYASAQEVYTSSGKAGYHKKTKREKGYDPSKLVVGGGLSAGFGSGFAVAGIAPIVGYNFAHNFTAGVGLGYLYSQAPDYDFPDFYDKEHIIYPNLWARYIVFRGLYLTATYEYDIIQGSFPGYDINAPTPTVINTKENVTASCLLAGVGLKQPLGGRVSFFAEVTHDLLQQTYSPYAGQFLVFHAGIAAGL